MHWVVYLYGILQFSLSDIYQQTICHSIPINTYPSEFQLHSQLDMTYLNSLQATHANISHDELLWLHIALSLFQAHILLQQLNWTRDELVLQFIRLTLQGLRWLSEGLYIPHVHGRGLSQTSTHLIYANMLGLSMCNLCFSDLFFCSCSGCTPPWIYTEYRD